MIKRVSRSLSDVAAEVLHKLKTEHGVTDKQLDQLRHRVFNAGYRFPYGGIRQPIEVLWIDYEVQRDVIIKHILGLLKKWDNRICQPAACNTHPSLVELIDEAKNIYRFKKLFVYVEWEGKEVKDKLPSTFQMVEEPSQGNLTSSE